MPLRMWDGSAFKEAGAIKVWNGSTWVTVTNAYTWNGSAWTKFFPSVKITNQSASNPSLAGIGGTATATYRLSSTGEASSTVTSNTLVPISGEWLVGGTASDYEVQGTWSGSGGTVGGPSGWVSLGTTRDFTLTVTSAFITRDLALEIRIAASTLVVATATITFDVDSAP
jgi:hypothetical protein